MKNSLFFLRHGKLTLPYKDHSEMPLEVLADLASLRLNPPIDTEFASQQVRKLTNAIPFGSIERIYSSPSRRCRETALFISNFMSQNYGRNIEPVIAQELKEIKFDLLKILPQESKHTLDIDSLNDSVFRAMTKTNEHCESASSAYRRITSFLRPNIGSAPTLFITHDFIMRVIETYIRDRGEHQSGVTYEELKETRRNLYLQGFATDPSFESFLAV